MDLRTAAAYLGCSYWTLRDLVPNGHIPAVRIPSPRLRDGRVMRRILIDSRDLERLIERCKEVDDPPQAPSTQMHPVTTKGEHRMGMTYKRGTVWWVKYYRNGRPIRESSHSGKESDAINLLKLREGDIAHGLPVKTRSVFERYNIVSDGDLDAAAVRLNGLITLVAPAAGLVGSSVRTK
jgi:excisionase family DNA binding protein